MRPPSRVKVLRPLEAASVAAVGLDLQAASFTEDWVRNLGDKAQRAGAAARAVPGRRAARAKPSFKRRDPRFQARDLFRHAGQPLPGRPHLKGFDDV